MKRILDVVVASVLLLLTSWLQLLIALVIRLDSPGAPLFHQTRVGRQGKPFVMYKFRTMRTQPPGARKPLMIDDFKTFVFAPPGPDPRVTRAGRLLRATSLDELPQLWNVLKGEMSLVGPRPELPEIVDQYPPAYHSRHTLRPGVTGLAQISGRADLTYHQIIMYDLDYIASHSLWRDLAILMRTAAVVLTGRGAR